MSLSVENVLETKTDGEFAVKEGQGCQVRVLGREKTLLDGIKDE